MSMQQEGIRQCCENTETLMEILAEAEEDVKCGSVAPIKDTFDDLRNCLKGESCSNEQEKSDYTKWRQMYFAEADPDEFHAAAVAYGKANPLK